MRPLNITAPIMVAAAATAVAASQTPTVVQANANRSSSVPAGYPFTLNGTLVTGGVAVFDVARRVSVVCASSENKTLTVYGTNAQGMPQVETITLTGTSAITGALNFKTVTGAYLSAAAAGAITIGTAAVASVLGRLDEWASGSELLLNANLTVAGGTVNYTIQGSTDDPNDPSQPVAEQSMNWFDIIAAGAVSAKANIAYVPLWVRILINSGGANTGVNLVVTQTGNAQY